MKTKTIFFFLLFFSTSAFASGTVTNLYIDEIITGYAEDDVRSTVRIKLTANHANRDNCTSQNFITIIDDDEVSGTNDDSDIASTFFHQQYAMVLAASNNSNQLKAFVDGCAFSGKYPIAKRLHLLQ